MRLIEAMTSVLEEKLLRESLNEARNLENEEINALLRKYVGKKNIPEKAKREIEAAGIEVLNDTYDKTIYFKGPHGKVLDASGRTWRSGPQTPQTKFDRNQFNKQGGSGETGWDMALNNNNSRMADRSSDLRQSWDAVDLKGYLDSDRKRMNPVERKQMVDPSYSLPADRYNQGDENLRPHSDPYRRLKSDEEDAISSRDFKRGYYDIKSDDDIEAEVQAFRDKLIRQNDYNKKNNQEAEDRANSATAAVDQYLKDKGIR